MPTPPGPVSLSKKLPNAVVTAGLSSRTPAGAQRGMFSSSVAQPGAPSQPNAGGFGAQSSPGGAANVALQASWCKSMIAYSPRLASTRTAASASSRYAASYMPGCGSTRDHDSSRRTQFQPIAAIRSASAGPNGKTVGNSRPCQYSTSALTLTPRSNTWRPSASMSRPPPAAFGSACNAGSRRVFSVGVGVADAVAVLDGIAVTVTDAVAVPVLTTAVAVAGGRWPPPPPHPLNRQIETIQARELVRIGMKSCLNRGREKTSWATTTACARFRWSCTYFACSLSSGFCVLDWRNTQQFCCGSLFAGREHKVQLLIWLSRMWETVRRATVSGIVIAAGALTTPAPVHAAADLNGLWRVDVFVIETAVSFSDICSIIITQDGPMVLLSGSCQATVSPVPIRGTLDPGTRSFIGSGTAGTCGEVTIRGTVAADSSTFTATFDCRSLSQTGTVNADRCGNGQLDAGETCDDGNRFNGDCCSAGCFQLQEGTLCSDDGNPSTTDTCNATGQCQHANRTGACSDLNSCTVGDTCLNGRCIGSVQPDNAACSDGNACTTGDVCVNGVCTGQPVACSACLSCVGELGCVP